MTTRWARVLRGLFVSAFATFAAAFSHGAADGAHPPLFAVALGLAFSSLACIALLGRRMPRTGLAIAVAVSQVFYHGLFSLFGAAATLPSALPADGIVRAHHHAPILLSPADPARGVAVAGGAVPADAWMLGAHAVAAMLTYGLVVYSARLCAAVATLAQLVISALSWLVARALQPVPVRFSRPRGTRIVIPHRSLILDSCLRHRGPPAAPSFA